MKLFLVLYAAGSLGGFQGPLPFGIEQCQAEARDFNSRVVVTIAMKEDGEGNPIPPEKLEKLKSLRAVCEYRAEMPKLGEREVIVKKEGTL